MMRTVTGVALAVVLFTGAALNAQAVKNQMVKGTIKSIDSSSGVLVVNQKVKNETVQRELAILDTTEFEVTTPKGTDKSTGKGALKLLEGLEGASIQVKCDKDVQVLKVTVKSSK